MAPVVYSGSSSRITRITISGESRVSRKSRETRWVPRWTARSVRTSQSILASPSKSPRPSSARVPASLRLRGGFRRLRAGGVDFTQYVKALRIKAP